MVLGWLAGQEPTALRPEGGGPNDRVEFFDAARGQRVTRLGRIKSEDAARLVLSPGIGADLTIPGPAIIDVQYDGLTVEWLAARNSERQRQWEAAQSQYEAALKLWPAGPSLARRHLEFKIVEMQVLRAETAAPPQRAAAREALRSWMLAHGPARQMPRAVELLWRLEWQDGGVGEGTLAVMRQVAEKARGDLELTLLCRWLDLRWQVRMIDPLWGVPARRSELRQRLGELAAPLAALRQQVPVSASHATELTAWLSVCLAAQGDITTAHRLLDEAVIQEGKATHRLGVLYLGRGLVLRLAGRPGEAIWPLLYVDVVYPGDPETHALALFHLAGVLAEAGNRRQARTYRERLLAEEWADTWAQRLAVRLRPEPGPGSGEK
jgi:tetratricopeptide (TPR) repeat protein